MRHKMIGCARSLSSIARGSPSIVPALRGRPALRQLTATGLFLALGAAALAQAPGPFPPGSERARILADWQRMGYKVPTDEVIIQLSPTANRKVIDHIAQNAEATTLTVKAGQDLADVVGQKCGDAASAFYGVHLSQLNPALQIDPANPKVTRPAVIKIPACAKFQFDMPVVTAKGDTLDSLVNKAVPAADPKDLGPEIRDHVRGSILKRYPSLATQDILPTGQQITLPFVTEPVRIKVKPGVNTDAFLAELAKLAEEMPGSKKRPFGLGFVPKTFSATTAPPEPTIIPPIPAFGSLRDTQCTPVAENWPFDAGKVAEAVSKLPIRNPAVVAVLDTGIEGVSDSSFSEVFPEDMFAINETERRAPPNEPDPDGNYYNRDIIGVQFPVVHEVDAKHHPPSPIGKGVYKYWDHGTHVAGLILGGTQFLDPKRGAGAAALRNQVLKNRLKLKIINVTSAHGQSAEFAQIVPLYFSYALTYARAQQVQIINISLSSLTRLPMPDELKPANILVVVAAGNDSRTLQAGDDSVYPGQWSRDSTNVVTVAASDATRGLADFSNRGEDYADIAAPGCKVPSFIDGLPTAIKAYSGTSQAAPLVSLTAALLISAGVSNAQAVRDRILLSADTEPKLAGMVRWGGLLNIPKALSIYDDLVELKSDKVGTFTPGRLTHPLNFAICEQTAKIPLLRMRKISLGADGRTVRYIFQDHSGSHLVVKHCPYDEENDLRFIEASKSENDARTIKLTDVRDVVLKMQHPPPL